MAQRGISIEAVRHVLNPGEVSEGYPTDFPYPSVLMLGWSEERPLDVVSATAPETKIIWPKWKSEAEAGTEINVRHFKAA